MSKENLIRNAGDTSSEYSIEEGDFGPRLVLQGDWKDEFLDYMLVNSIKEITVNYARGFNGTRLDFLQRLPFLEGLLLLVYHIPDISVVHHLHELRSFVNGCRDKTPLDFTQFPNLERCGINWRDGSESLFQCRRMVWLSISKYQGKDTEQFQQFVDLKTLYLHVSQVQDLAGLGLLHSLRSLSLYRLGHFTTLSVLSALTYLEALDIQTCKKLVDIEDIKALIGLTFFNIVNCGEIASLHPIKFLPNLRRIGFVGTDILDGDLSVLAESPTLENYIFNNRRHYSHRREEMLQLRDSRLRT